LRGHGAAAVIGEIVVAVLYAALGFMLARPVAGRLADPRDRGLPRRRGSTGSRSSCARYPEAGGCCFMRSSRSRWLR
jgi:hypothetical protein